jgi:hypothetical protein
MIAQCINETYVGFQNQKGKISRLAVLSALFGIVGSFSFGPMLILLFYGLSFYRVIAQSPFITAIFSCGIAWILAIVLGIKSLEKIDHSKQQLVGKKYAMMGILISVAWMVFVLVAFLWPAFYYVNS